MPKITAASIALTALAALVLTGCAGTTEPAADEAQETPQATVSETPTPEPTAEATRITATPEPTTEAPTGTPEEQFVAAAKSTLNGWGYWDFTDEQILGAGLYVCESPEALPDAIEGVYGETLEEFVTDARTILCP